MTKKKETVWEKYKKICDGAQKEIEKRHRQLDKDMLNMWKKNDVGTINMLK